MLALPPRSILVPLDFSESGPEALKVARGLLAEGGALHVVHVLDQLSSGEPGVIWGTIDDEGRRQRTLEALRTFVTDAGSTDATLHVEVASGNPAYRITDVAQRVHADLIVTPSHGRTGLARIALGSVAERVVRLAPCPVLVLRGKARG